MTRQPGAWPAVLLAALIALPLLGARDLWHPDEPRYGLVIREMVEEGRIWHPHANGVPYHHKPHLYFWLGAIASEVSGQASAAAARLPSALAFLVLIALAHDIGRQLAGPVAGHVASLVLATAWLPAWLSRRACLDVLLAACVAGAVAALLRVRSRAEEGSSSTLAALMAGACTGLGLMTKGPVTLLFVVPVAVALAAAGDRRSRRAVLRALLASVVALAIVLAAWLVPARLLGGYDVVSIVSEHVVQRATTGRDHVQPPWYFLTTLPGDFMPWTLAAVPALAWMLRRRKALDATEGAVLAWATVPLLVLSVIVEKRNIYVMPLLPAWAAVAGAWTARGGGEADVALRRVAWIAATLLAFAGLGTLAMMALPATSPETEAVLRLPGVTRGVWLLGALLLVAAAFVAASAWRKGTAVGIARTVAAAFGAVFLGAFLLLPRFDPIKSGRSMGETIRREVREAPLAMYPRTYDAYAYYGHRTIDDVTTTEDASAWLARAKRPAYVLVHEHQRANLPPDGDALPDVVSRARVGHRTVMLLRYDSSTGGRKP